MGPAGRALGNMSVTRLGAVLAPGEYMLWVSTAYLLCRSGSPVRPAPWRPPRSAASARQPLCPPGPRASPVL